MLPLCTCGYSYTALCVHVLMRKRSFTTAKCNFILNDLLHCAKVERYTLVCHLLQNLKDERNQKVQFPGKDLSQY